ncbi:MAG: SUMF1/EgtB/PvdO family nonheme iron enzyme [Saprospiraceae bacterium]
MQPDAPLKTFICYAHEDHEVVDGLKKQLAIFEKRGLLLIWSDGKILPGEHWHQSIKDQLEQAELVLLFISVDFINSDYIETTELKDALQRHREGHATLVPIIVRPCHWHEYFDIGQFQALPPKARPILSSHFPHRDEAFFEIAEGVKKTAESLRAKKTAAALAADLAASAAEAQRVKEEEDQRARQAAAEAQEAAEKAAAASAVLAAKQDVERKRRQADSRRLKDEAAWESATEDDTLHAYDTYLDEGFTLYKTEAEQKIKTLQAAELKRKAKEAEARKAKEAALAAEALAKEAAEEKAAEAKRQAAQKAKEAAEQKAKEEAEYKRANEKPSLLLPAMVEVKGGIFRLGDKVECTLSDFAIGKYQVTFDEYDRYCEAMKIKKPGDEGWGRGRRPVINVSWFDAVAYCNWLSEQSGLAPAYKIEKEEVGRIAGSKGFRLPTEAEWEFAARGGQGGVGYEYAGSNNLDEVGWYNKNSGNQTHPVGEKKANELGLHDMSGNVYEWCWDWYGDYTASKQENPQEAASGSSRVVRGGCWLNIPNYCRSAYRYNRNPFNPNYWVGFRVVRHL